MIRFTRSIATGLAIGYGLLVTASIALVAVAFYLGTIGVLDRGNDSKITSISDRLSDKYDTNINAGLSQEIEKQIDDGINSDSEILLLLSADGHRVAGNLSTWPRAGTPVDTLVTTTVIREGRPSKARLIIQTLPNGGRLIIGRDLREQEMIGKLVVRSILAGAALSVLLVIAGAMFFRRQIDRRIGHIRRIALEIEAGDLAQRIPASSDDEFGRLGLDINRMLDRIEQLMSGVRHVSNAIAHDLRTPLTRLRVKLDEAAQGGLPPDRLADVTHEAVSDIDDVIQLFEKLLQIAEAESGVRASTFTSLDLNRIAGDMVELYDASAEEKGVVLRALTSEPVIVRGDHDLLANAVASLIDNAIKYVDAGCTVDVSVIAGESEITVEVRDNGPGVPDSEIPRLTERFYRLDHSRSQPGNGLGLSIVSAISTLHGGQLRILPGHPGVIARIVMARPAPGDLSNL